MSAYERLAEQERASRYTIADALEVLRAAGFKSDDRAEARITHLKPPSGTVIGLVDIEFAAGCDKKIYLVSLPTSAQFTAARQGLSGRERFQIGQLDGAKIDDAGNVTLADGTIIRAVEVNPVRLPYEPSDLEWRILRHTIALLGAEESCYRHLGDGLPPDLRKMVPDVYGIDCGKLIGLPCPPLKVIAAYIADHEPSIGALSEQKIADALRVFGVRVPRPRPRRPRRT